MPGTKGLSCTEDGVLLTQSGKPAKEFTRELKGGAYISKPRVQFTGEDGKRHSMSVEKLVDAARTGVAPKMGRGRYVPGNQRHKESERAWRRRALAEMEKDPSHRLHGKASGYKAGCRCERCRNANLVLIEQSKLRKALKEMGVNPWTGGEMPEGWRRSSSTGSRR